MKLVGMPSLKKAMYFWLSDCRLMASYIQRYKIIIVNISLFLSGIYSSLNSLEINPARNWRFWVELFLSELGSKYLLSIFIKKKAPRKALIIYLTDFKISKVKSQNICTVFISIRSSGEWAPLMVGPNEIISILG